MVATVVVLLLFAAPADAQMLFGDKGVIVGNNVRVRDKASLKGKFVTTVNAGDQVAVMGQGDQPEILSKTDFGCEKDGYYWFLIKTKKGDAGWVYGKYLYRFPGPGGGDQINKPMRDKVGLNYGSSGKYEFHFGIEYSVTKPAVDGCIQQYFPFFVEEGVEKGYPIMYQGSVVKFNWSGESGADMLEGIYGSVESPNVILLEIKYGDGEGGTGYRFYKLIKRTDYFIMDEMTDTGLMY